MEIDMEVIRIHSFDGQTVWLGTYNITITFIIIINNNTNTIIINTR